jgi:hypothetical protein
LRASTARAGSISAMIADEKTQIGNIIEILQNQPPAGFAKYSGSKNQRIHNNIDHNNLIFYTAFRISTPIEYQMILNCV